MQIPVVIEPIGDGQFRAQTFLPLTAVATGWTSDEALSNLRNEVQKEVESGRQMVMLDIDLKEENPLMRIAGSLKNNPLFDEWQEAMREFRQQRDIEDDLAAER